MICY
jgi:hypothetical protein